MHFAHKISRKPFHGLRLKTFPVMLLIFTLAFQMSIAQFTEEFSDGDFDLNPPWLGTTNHFMVNSEFQLQLDDVAAGSSWLTTALPSLNGSSTTWEFVLRQGFSPSSANFGRIYLSSDNNNLSGPLNGYYLQFGEAGSNDAIELFRQSGTTSTSICRGASATIANAFGVRVKVVRIEGESWQLYADYSGGSDFKLEATGNDAALAIGGYFGIRCTYTITNATRFYLDNIHITTYDMPDTTPPHLLSLRVISAHSLELFFSEQLDAASVIPTGFMVFPDEVAPSLISIHDDLRTIVLDFTQSFRNGVSCVLQLSHVRDQAGNILSTVEANFVFFKESPVSYRDIIFSEIMADPNPSRGLPESEFVELYNRSKNPVNLSGWALSDGNTEAKLKEFIFLPEQYLILVPMSLSESYTDFGQKQALSSFPSLNNSGDVIVLKDDKGLTVDSLRYTSSWYRDEEKAEGGWTLERIDAHNICDEHTNWTASDAVEGGTPGRQNSVAATRPDHTGPKMISVVAVDSATLLLSFDEILSRQIPSVAEFAIQPPLEINSLRLDSSGTGLLLQLSEYIHPGSIYTITVGDIYDCPGNRIVASTITAAFVLPQHAVAGDLVINEILFNPRPTGVDFVEVYNCSQKTVNLKGWSLRNHSSGTPDKFVFSKYLLLYPGEYVVFTEDPNILKGEYLNGVEKNFFKTTLPAMNDDMGFISLISDFGSVIDSMFYSEDFHTPYLKDGEGVSLERISSATIPAVASNWRSASSVSGFATPGYLNSNSRASFEVEDGAVTIEPEVVLPMVPLQDFARIKYRFSNGGLIANVRIYDQVGRSVREIAANELLGTEGFFRWDGQGDDGSLAGRGYYMVWFEVFDADGKVQTFRRRIAIL